MIEQNVSTRLPGDVTGALHDTCLPWQELARRRQISRGPGSEHTMLARGCCTPTNPRLRRHKNICRHHQSWAFLCPPRGRSGTLRYKPCRLLATRKAVCVKELLTACRLRVRERENTGKSWKRGGTQFCWPRNATCRPTAVQNSEFRTQNSESGGRRAEVAGSRWPGGTCRAR